MTVSVYKKLPLCPLSLFIERVSHTFDRISIGCVPIITISILRVLTRVQEEDSSKASSSELGPTTSDMSKFETLSLNDSPPALDSSDRYDL
jgi:hypothetical protein